MSGLTADTRTREVRHIVSTVVDPEIPVLSIVDLGILRDISIDESGRITVAITPTYSGCPAMDVIAADVTSALRARGYDDVDVRLVLAPAWTTDWITQEGRDKLVAYGIAPPSGRAPVRGGPVLVDICVRCPQCGALDTQEVSRFGSTACKSLWSCRSCLEPFDHFKVL